MIDIHALSGAYAVDAVDDIERAQFERHLAGCASCRSEVDSLREAAALLPETAAQAAPAGLRTSVLSGIQTVRPLPPVVVAATEKVESTRRWFPALVAASVALIAIGGAGATVWHPWSPDDRPAATEAGQVDRFSQDIVGGGTVTVVRSKQSNEAYVTVTGLRPLDREHVYEMWLIHDGEMVPAGIMDGNVSKLLLDGDARTATGAGITIEKTGGSQVPTLPPVVQFDFEQA